MRYTYRLPVPRQRKNFIFILAALLLIIVVFFLIFKLENLDIVSFLASFTRSLIKITLSYAISLALALLLAFVTLESKATEKLLLPLLDVLQSFPSFALLPILLAYFGRTFLSIVIILVIAMIWPILFSIIGGFKTIKGDVGEAATIFGSVGIKRVLFFTIPSLMPSIVTGSIVAWGEAWETVIGAEIILKSSGLGNFFVNLSGVKERGILIIAVIGLLILLFMINKLIWLPLLEKVTKYQTE